MQSLNVPCVAIVSANLPQNTAGQRMSFHPNGRRNLEALQIGLAEALLGQGRWTGHRASGEPGE